MKAACVFVFALSLLSLPTFARAPLPPTPAIWVTGEERDRLNDQLRDLSRRIEQLEDQLDSVSDELRTCKAVHST